MTYYYKVVGNKSCHSPRLLCIMGLVLPLLSIATIQLGDGSEGGIKENSGDPRNILILSGNFSYDSGMITSWYKETVK